MLEDVELVESLEETKRTAVSVTQQVKAAKESEVLPPSYCPVTSWNPLQPLLVVPAFM